MEHQVREFHKKYKLSADKLLSAEGGQEMFDSKDLEYTADKIEILVKTIKHRANAGRIDGDDRLYRLYLILGEVLEISRALATKDEIELADGLGDLEFVTEGTAVTYSIPLKEVFDEIHRSNMTKMQSDVRDDETRDNKTDEFVAPDIAGAISRGRGENQFKEDLFNHDVEAIFDVLSLVEDEFPAKISIESLKMLTDETLSEITAWAASVYAQASDNDVEIPEMSNILKGE